MVFLVGRAERGHDDEAYQTLRDEQLATLRGVRRLTSTIVMKRIVDERPFVVQPDHN